MGSFKRPYLPIKLNTRFNSILNGFAAAGAYDLVEGRNPVIQCVLQIMNGQMSIY